MFTAYPPTRRDTLLKPMSVTKRVCREIHLGDDAHARIEHIEVVRHIEIADTTHHFQEHGQGHVAPFLIVATVSLLKPNVSYRSDDVTTVSSSKALNASLTTA